MTAPIETWIDGYLAVRHHAFESRGLVELECGPRWPRTIGADVIAIAAVFDYAIRTQSTPGMIARWRLALGEIERHALPSPQEIYIGNRGFWSLVETAAVFLDDLAVSPPFDGVWHALIAAISRPLRNGPKGDGPFKHFDNVKTFADLWTAQQKHLIELRGADELDPVALDENSYGTGGVKKRIPRTTNLDVLTLAGYWGTQLDDVKKVFGHESIERRWNRALQDVMKLAMYADPTKVYPKNNQFWRELFETAVYVSVADEAPSKWDMAVDSVKDSVHKLPQTLGNVAEKAGDVVGGTAHAVGRVANEIGRGLFEGLGTPLLIGAGLIGLFLITRDRDKHEET